MTTRQDAWQEKDDLTLSETVLAHIRSGSTQLSAFEEAAEKLNRTSAACGFRWNSEVRKRYETEIAQAKQFRKNNKKVSKRSIGNPLVMISNNTLELNEHITVTDSAEQIIQATAKMKQQYASLLNKLTILADELQRARQEIETLKNRLYSQHPEAAASDDYHMLIRILQRARSLGVLEKSSG